LQTKLSGFGPVHPKKPGFQKQLGAVLRQVEVNRVLAQKLTHNTKVTPIRAWDELEKGEGYFDEHYLEDGVPGFLRTKEASDGVVVSITGETGEMINAVMIMAADCGGTRILAPNGELAVLHSSLQCVDAKNGEDSIITNAIDYFESQGIDPSELQMQIGNAARSCCFGLDDPKYKVQNEKRRARLIKDYGDAVIRSIPYPPRMGGIGIDVPLLAARQAEKRRVKDIDVSGLCTACHGLIKRVMKPEDWARMEKMDTYGDFSSHLRTTPGIDKERGWAHRDAVVVYGK
jgi:copper oxidase (laccase) domain-containing protein